MTKQELDIFEKMVCFNKLRYGMLQEMSEIEIAHMNSMEEYQTLKTNYKLIYDSYRKLKSTVANYNSLEWANTLLGINHLEERIGELNTLDNLLKIKENYIPILRSIQDFGFYPFCFVSEKNARKLPVKNVTFTNSILGIITAVLEEKQKEENRVDSNIANNLIDFDFYHTLFWMIENKLNNEQVLLRDWLIYFKNNLILLNPSLEKTIVSNRWNTANTLTLVDYTTIRTLGISTSDYQNLLNCLCFDQMDLLEEKVKIKYHQTQEINQEMFDQEFLLDSLIFQTLFFLISNGEDKNTYLEITHNILNSLDSYQEFCDPKYLERMSQYYQNKINIINEDANLQKIKNKSRETILF